MKSSSCADVSYASFTIEPTVCKMFTSLPFISQNCWLYKTAEIVCVCVWHRESVWASLNGSCVFVQPHRGQGGGLSTGARVGISGADCLRQKAQQSWGSVVFVKVIKSELRDLRHLLVFFHLLHYFFISSSTAVCSVSHSQILAEDFKSDCVTLFKILCLAVRLYLKNSAPTSAEESYFMTSSPVTGARGSDRISCWCSVCRFT